MHYCERKKMNVILHFAMVELVSCCDETQLRINVSLFISHFNYSPRLKCEISGRWRGPRHNNDDKMKAATLRHCIKENSPRKYIPPNVTWLDIPRSCRVSDIPIEIIPSRYKVCLSWSYFLNCTAQVLFFKAVLCLWDIDGISRAPYSPDKIASLVLHKMTTTTMTTTNRTTTTLRTL